MCFDHILGCVHCMTIGIIIAERNCSPVQQCWLLLEDSSWNLLQNWKINSTVLVLQISKNLQRIILVFVHQTHKISIFEEFSVWRSMKRNKRRNCCFFIPLFYMTHVSSHVNIWSRKTFLRRYSNAKAIFNHRRFFFFDRTKNEEITYWVATSSYF